MRRARHRARCATASVVIVKGIDKGGNLQVSELTSDGKHLQMRTLGVNGDTQSTETVD